MGTCSPRFLRLTLNQMPNSKELARKLAIPLAVVIQVSIGGCRRVYVQAYMYRRA